METNDMVQAETTPTEAEVAPNIAALYAAFAAAQGEFPEIGKTRVAEVRMKTGGAFKFKYADLADVMRAVRAPLAKHGLSASQGVRGENIVSTLRHSSGAEISETYPIHHKPEGRMHPAQEYAIAIQFARRYAMCALLGISADESVQDDRNKLPNERFEDPDRDGIIGVKGVNVANDSTPEQRAAAYAEGIIAQFDAAKTPAGLNGVWDRNQKVIDRLQDSYPDDYNNLLDAYEARQKSMNEGDE